MKYLLTYENSNNRIITQPFNTRRDALSLINAVNPRIWLLYRYNKNGDNYKIIDKRRRP